MHKIFSFINKYELADKINFESRLLLSFCFGNWILPVLKQIILIPKHKLISFSSDSPNYATFYNMHIQDEVTFNARNVFKCFQYYRSFELKSVFSLSHFLKENTYVICCTKSRKMVYHWCTISITTDSQK